MRAPTRHAFPSTPAIALERFNGRDVTKWPRCYQNTFVGKRSFRANWSALRTVVVCKRGFLLQTSMHACALERTVVRALLRQIQRW